MVEWNANRFAGYEGPRGAEGQGWEGLYRVYGTIGEDTRPGEKAEAGGLRLEGSRITWLDSAGNVGADPEALLISKEGEVRKIVFEKEGRMLVRMRVEKDVLGVGPIPAEALCVPLLGNGPTGENVLFVGGLQGDSVLYRVGKESGQANGSDLAPKGDVGGEIEDHSMDVTDGECVFLFLLWNTNEQN